MPLEYNDPTDPSRQTFDLDKSVGVGSVNQRDDVKLVQYFLREIYAAKFATPPGPSLEMDGWIGPITISWIRKFQADVNVHGHKYAVTEEFKNPAIKKCTVDGRVDVILNSTSLGQISGTPYTIIWMNQILKKLNLPKFRAIPTVVPCKKVAYYQRPNPYNPEGPATQPTVAGGF